MSTAVADIIAYHERTKHRPERYASGPHDLGLGESAKPFRRFTGAPLFQPPLACPDDTPSCSRCRVFGAAIVGRRAQFTLDAVSLFIELSLGLSARKEIADSLAGICG